MADLYPAHISICVSASGVSSSSESLSRTIAADEFGEAIGLVRGGGAHGAHFVEDAGHSAAGDLPSGFGAGQAAAGDVDGLGQG